MNPAPEPRAASDPITLAVVRGSLDAITREMAAVMLRTARSPVLKLSRDFSNALFSGDAVMVAQGEDLPCQLGTLMFTCKAVRSAFGDDIEPGDVFVHNDPATGGNHLADLALLKPVFAGDELVFWAGVKAHMLDTGGSMAGAYNPTARDIFSEGMRVPAMKLYARGAVRRDVWRLLLANVRTEREQEGDMRAMVSAVGVAEERLLGLVRRYGLKRITQTLAEHLDASELRMRAEIADMADGEYTGVATVEPYREGASELAVRARVAIAGDRCQVTLEAPPQVDGYINSYRANSVGAVLLGLLSYCDPAVPHNEGAYRAVDIDVGPAGTLTNAHPPAPSGLATTTVGDNITDAVRAALSTAMPERAVAGSSHTSGVNVAGVDPRDGSFFVYMAMAGLLGGGGASARSDGWHCVGTAAADGAMSAGDIELLEYEYPIHTHAYQLRPDSGGAGAHRGGCGSVYAIEVEGGDAELSCWGEGVRHPAMSLGTAVPRPISPVPRLARRRVSGPRGRRDLPAHGADTLVAGELLELHSPGGGGVGDPYLRAPEAVLADVHNGLVTVDAARLEYGVALVGEPPRVDQAATATLRGAA